jgi:phosphodiesterase/alkaline phosphatase D-like protein
VYTSAVAPDANGIAQLSITGLSSSTTYYYGIEVDGAIDAARNGTFKSYPAYGAASYSFAFASCTLSGSNHAVFDTLRNRNPLFFHHLGDLHYDNITTNDQTLYRAAWDTVLGRPRQAALYANVAWDYNWSDHDSGDNDHDDTEPSIIAAAALYREYMPGYSLPAADNQGIYHTYVVGRVRYIVTDLRSYKDPSANADNASKTMMGAAQKAWFKARLLDPEPLKIWCCELPWVGATTSGSDFWAGYNTERQELASFVTLNKVNLMIIAGDQHCLAADDGTNSAGNIPVFHAAPLSQTTSEKGGPYSEGFYPNPTGASANQFGWMDVTDNGTTITLSFNGYDSAGAQHITMTKVVTPHTVEAWGVPV